MLPCVLGADDEKTDRQAESPRDGGGAREPAGTAEGNGQFGQLPVYIFTCHHFGCQCNVWGSPDSGPSTGDARPHVLTHARHPERLFLPVP